MKRLALCAVLALSLAACGKHHGPYGEKYYKDSDKAANTVKVPHGIASPVGEQLYPVPVIHGQTPSAKKVSLLPPDPQLHHAISMHNKPH
jgi:uncharacterized lipoprotein